MDKTFITSFFGLGKLKPAPGTWGSAGTAAIFVLTVIISGQIFGAWIMAILAALAGLACVNLSEAVEKKLNQKDPGQIVVDEVAGQAVAYFIAAPFMGETLLVTAALCFLLFRIFDIIKPWPLRRLEKLPAGWGILADDLVAGIYAGIVYLIMLAIGWVYWLDNLVQFGGKLNTLGAAILGIVQGLTEFLPVSSSGHLVLMEHFMKLQPEKPEMLLFDLAVHVGTLLAIIIVFFPSFVKIFKNLIKFKKYGSKVTEIYKKNPAVHLLTLAVVTTIVTGMLGMLFEDFFERFRSNLGLVSIMWVITATLLLITDWRKQTRKGLRQLGFTAAIIIGLAQTAALAPGISRSGATICAAILIGLHRRWAVEYSFLIAIPAILGAATLTAAKNFDILTSGTLQTRVWLTGMILAALTGVFALKVLIKASRKKELKIFAIYCYILAIFVGGYHLITS